MTNAAWFLVAPSVVFGLLWGACLVDWLWERKVKRWQHGERVRIGGQVWELRKALHVVRVDR